MFSIFGRLSARLASIPYAIVGLAARIVIAYPFFMSGQSKIDGNHTVDDKVTGFAYDNLFAPGKILADR